MDFAKSVGPIRSSESAMSGGPKAGYSTADSWAMLARAQGFGQGPLNWRLKLSVPATALKEWRDWRGYAGILGGGCTDGG